MVGRADGDFARSWTTTLRVALLTLVASIPSCTSDSEASTRRSVQIAGRVVAGESFHRTIGDRFRFALTPIDCGWYIQVFEKSATGDLSRFTPPFHFVPNPRYLEGWHFRNSDNTGPNVSDEKNVNAPQRIRDFIFSPEVAQIPGKPTSEDVERIRTFGRGRLEIVDFELGNLRKGTRAVFQRLQFRATLSWPR